MRELPSEISLAEANKLYSVDDPPTWCGAVATLYAGEEETPSLVEKLRSEDGAVVTERDSDSDLVLVTRCI